MNGYIAAGAVAAVACLGGCLAFRHYYRRKMEKIYQELLQKLDKAMGGEKVEAVCDESMDGAVAERLNRLMEIYGMNRERAEKERDTVKSLISDISHQVRTPLSNIMLYAGLLEEQELNPQAQRLAQKIKKQSDKLAFFMKELTRSSYAEQEMIALHPEISGVGEMLHTACQMAEVSALKKNIEIVCEDTEAVCWADKKWTIEALGNVLDNAVKYSPEGSRVTLRTILYESFVCIEVKDQGIGIRESEQGKVFGRFYRSADVKDEPGFGIGLYLAREVMTKQRGYVRIRSEQGKGTAVQLYFSRYGGKAAGQNVSEMSSSGKI